MVLVLALVLVLEFSRYLAKVVHALVAAVVHVLAVHAAVVHV